MNVLETEWWTLALPPEWWADSEEDSILVGDQDDVGCIEISTLFKDDGVFDDEQLRVIAAEDASPEQTWSNVELGDFSGIHSSYIDDEAAIREWYIACGATLLFITYSCDEDNRGMDDSAVNEILDTLMIVDTSE